jgi:hypothetical protein
VLQRSVELAAQSCRSQECLLLVEQRKTYAQLEAFRLRPKADINPGSRQVSIPARLAPSRVKVMPDKMAVMTLGGGYGAAIKN